MSQQQPTQRLSDAEIASSEELDNGTNTYLIQTEDGRVEYIGKSERNRLLIETDFYEKFDEGGSIEFTVDGVDIEFEIPEGGRKYILTVDDEVVVIPTKDEGDALQALHEDMTYGDSLGMMFAEDGGAGENLHEFYLELIEGQVRRNTVNKFADSFPEERVNVTAAGWTVDDTFVVNWDAENYFLDDVDAHVVSGRETVESDESHEALSLTPTIDVDKTELEDSSGETHLLSETEVQFLATVDYLVNADVHLPEKHAEEIRQARVERSVDDPFGDEVSEMAETMNVNGFMDPKSGLVHGHDTAKHTLRSNLKATWDTLDMMFSSSFDHAGVAELAMREEEFRRADFDVFQDTGNNDDRRWDQVHSAAEKAPIPDDARQELKAKFGR